MVARFYVREMPTSGKVRLEGSEAHHLVHVLRMSVGQKVTLFDGLGYRYRAVIERIERRFAELSVFARERTGRDTHGRIVVGVAFPKGDRQRWMVEKLTEVGVGKVVPLHMPHAGWRAAPTHRVKLERAVIEACKQCGRDRLMEIGEPSDWATFVRDVPPEAAGFLADPSGESPPSVDELCTRNACWVAVGPETGFSCEQVAAARESGWRVVTLGPSILRTETAAIVLAGWARLASTTF